MNKFIYILILAGVCSCYIGDELPPDQEVWEYAHPASVRLDDQHLLNMDSAVKLGSYEQINGIIIIKDDQMVFENYYDYGGRNEVNSVGRLTFSILTLTLDLFIRDGYISLDEPIHHYLPEYNELFEDDSLKRLITIRHLIAFKSGLVWKESAGGQNDLFQFENQADWLRYVLSKPIEAPPGYRTVINSGGGLIIAKILQNQLGDEPLLNYLEDHFFSKIGIDEVAWETDPEGTLNGSTGLSLTTRDLTRIGYLMLNEGRWTDKQRVISRDWVLDITSAITEPDIYFNLGYTWWRFTDSFNSTWLALEENTCFYAAGERGQHLYVIPGESMVICISADNFRLSFDNPSLFLFLNSLESLQPAAAN